MTPAQRVVRGPDPLVAQAVRLHIEALSYRSFLTSLGEGFLRRLYDGLLAGGDAFLVAATEADRLVGFILAVTDSRRLFSFVLRHPLRFGPSVARALLRRPWLLRKVLETLAYPRREGASVPAELVVIAVDADRRSSGIGRELLAGLHRELAARGVDAYKVTVHAAMRDSNRFYLTNGFTLDRTFELYGVPWNLYLRRL